MPSVELCEGIPRIFGDFYPQAGVAQKLSHQLPDATLIPYPVVSDKIRSSAWLTDPAIMKLLISEYLKYVFAVVRMHLDPDLA